MIQHIIACAGGKSGGHIIPCLTLAAQHHPSHSILYFSTNTPLDHSIISKHHQVSHHVPLQFGTKNYTSMFGKFRMLLQAATAFITSFYNLIRHRPQAIISTGGAVSVPVCIAAWIMRIPIHLYELNAVPGKAITFLAPFATTINVCFPKAQNYFNAKKCTVIHYPIRFSDLDKKLTPAAARKQLHLLTDRKTLLILGGSQGSSFLNKIIMQWLQKNPDQHNHIQIIHQTGAAEIARWQQEYKQLNIVAHVFAYHPNMAIYYQAADLIICRAGAGTLFELIYFEKPCIVIPLETVTTSHQKDNAQALQKMYPDLVQVVAQSVVEQHGLSINKD